MQNITDLIGRNQSEPAVVAFVAALGAQVCTDMFGGLRIRDYPDRGISLYFDESDVLVSAFLFDAGVEGHVRYAGVLPHDSSFSDTRREVLARYGTPERSGPGWDRFAWSRYLVHFQYSAAGTVSMITVMTPQTGGEPNHPLERTGLRPVAQFER